MLQKLLFVKSRTLLLSALGALIFGISCEKDAESVVNCIAESVLVSLHSTADASNSKKIDFEVQYSGTLTVSQVQWQFGDGNTATTNGTTTSHTYANAGPYAVKAVVKLSGSGSNCSVEPTKNITVN